MACEDCLQRGGGLFTRPEWTIRRVNTDYPKLAPEPPVACREIRTVCTLPADRPHPCRGSSTKPLATENTRLDRSNQELARTSDELDTRLVPDNAARARASQSQHQLPFARSPE
jgi:hypothetical protein